MEKEKELMNYWDWYTYNAEKYCNCMASECPWLSMSTDYSDTATKVDMMHCPKMTEKYSEYKRNYYDNNQEE